MDKDVEEAEFQQQKVQEEPENQKRFCEILGKGAPYPLPEMLDLIRGLSGSYFEKDVKSLLAALQEAKDFEAVIALVKALENDSAKKFRIDRVNVGAELKKATTDRLLLAYVDSIRFPERKLPEALLRLDLLLSFRPGVAVFSKAWGLGEVRGADAFYRRLTVDFAGRPGHQFSFDAACETLKILPEDHVLVQAKKDPEAFERMLRGQKGEFVKALLRSFGPLTGNGLKNVAVQSGFMKETEWKAFFGAACKELRKDEFVDVPSRTATEFFRLRDKAEDYGSAWVSAFSALRDPKLILEKFLVFRKARPAKGAKDTAACLAAYGALAERLDFAMRVTRESDEALFARFVFLVDELATEIPGLSFAGRDAKTVVDEARDYLWENDRFLFAARNLPAGEMETFVRFLAASTKAVPAGEGEPPLAPKAALFGKLCEMQYPLLVATIKAFRGDVVSAEDAAAGVSCEAAVVKLLKSPHPPATLVAYATLHWNEFRDWRTRPSYAVVLEHAICLGEGLQSGETLKMQNAVREKFANEEWLTAALSSLTMEERGAVFERFQASTEWDPATHNVIVVRMIHAYSDELSGRVVKKSVKKVAARVTSARSYAEMQAAYARLVNVELPENTKRIEFAKSYGDLSENAEYQYAKDEQRQLLQKQAKMQGELNAVRESDFRDVRTDVVSAGTTVGIEGADGVRMAYTILGEWDNDPALGIIANRTSLAANMLGRRVDESFDLPSGGVARIVSIQPLSEEIRAWMKVLPQANA